MKVLAEKLKFDKKDNKTHIRYNFKLDREYKKIIIKFNYSPSVVPKNIAREVAKRTAEEYIPKDYENYKMVYDIMADFRVLNILTLSLSREDEFIGSYHNENNNQELIISEGYSSLGFNKTRIYDGEYILTLSFMNINSEVIGNLLVEVE